MSTVPGLRVDGLRVDDFPDTAIVPFGHKNVFVFTSFTFTCNAIVPGVKA